MNMKIQRVTEVIRLHTAPRNAFEFTPWLSTILNKIHPDFRHTAEIHIHETDNLPVGDTAIYLTYSQYAPEHAPDTIRIGD